MKVIFKTWKKNTYIKGFFELRNNSRVNWATPINFPTVFVAFGKGIMSGNWQSCTCINSPDYVINEYFDSVGHEKHDIMYKMWECCKQLDNVSWDDVNNNNAKILELIALANSELSKLKQF
jgi:hypothetical protein